MTPVVSFPPTKVRRLLAAMCIPGRYSPMKFWKCPAVDLNLGVSAMGGGCSLQYSYSKLVVGHFLSFQGEVAINTT